MAIEEIKLDVQEPQPEEEANTPVEDNQDFEFENEKEDFDIAPKRPTLLLGVLMILIVLATIFFGYHYSGKVEAQESELMNLDNQISTLELQIRSEELRGEKQKEELRQIKKSLTSADYRILWSKVIEEIEDITRRTVKDSGDQTIYTFNGYSLSEKGTIPLSGFTNSYSAIADLIEEFENSDKFSDVRFTSSSKNVTPDGQERASLSLSVKLAEDAFTEESGISSTLVETNL